MSGSAIQKRINPKPADLGEFSVKRALPAASQKTVGLFIFFDHFGPTEFEPGKGVAVRPHPHIGIATVTYLFEGEIIHRDSLGYEQAIQPGAVNWMTAGRGIVHSERTRPSLVETGSKMHGIQAWVALPLEDEECEPDFTHYPVEGLPVIDTNGVWMRLICGSAFGMKSEVKSRSPIFYVEVKTDNAGSVVLTDEYTERALYLVSGNLRIDGEIIEEGEMLIFKAGATTTIESLDASRFMLLGGEPLEEDRTVWWNFVSSRKDRIEQAKLDWKQNRFKAVPGDSEFIPLPKD